jgi:hypothetical protein
VGKDLSECKLVGVSTEHATQQILFLKASFQNASTKGGPTTDVGLQAGMKGKH